VNVVFPRIPSNWAVRVYVPAEEKYGPPVLKLVTKSPVEALILAIPIGII